MKKTMAGSDRSRHYHLAGGLCACGISGIPGKPPAGTPESMVVGLPSPPESSALVYIADEQHFFADNGLNVTIKEYDTGVNAVNDMITTNSPDIAVATEYIIVGKAFEQEKIYGIGSIARQEIFYHRRPERPWNSERFRPRRGKRSVSPRGQFRRFYLGRFLELHGISLRDVTIVDTSARRNLTTPSETGRSTRFCLGHLCQIPLEIGWVPMPSSGRIRVAS